MTTTTINQFFVFGILNSSGETFSGKKNYASIIDGGKKAKSFYKGLGFKKIKTVSLHGTVLVKDNNDRLLSFVAPISHMNKKSCIDKEYNTAYWAWNEVKRQAKAVAEKTAVEPSVNSDTEEEEVFVRPEGQNKNFYAVISKEYTGFVLEWARCKELTDGKSSKFKGFNGLEAAKAWMRENNAPSNTFEHITDIRQIK
uniref:Ribonuclease H1 n=1 Tax=Myoviridae sp. ctJ2i1 TaxID=2825079 RepID=A0A8S5V1F6_9CAUD|nr:MAG TPA: Ribonuclease H1 [Myoviridae sp. ctJ2i1]